MAKTPLKTAGDALPIDGAAEMKTYLIEKSAPGWIAGKRVGDAKEIELTDGQALMELLSGHIWPKSIERKPATPDDTSNVA